MKAIICPSCYTSQTPYSDLATSVFCINCGLTINIRQQTKQTAAQTEKLLTIPQEILPATPQAPAYKTMAMQSLPTRVPSTTGGLVFAIVGPIALITILFFALIGAGALLVANANRRGKEPIKPTYKPSPSPVTYLTPKMPEPKGGKNGELITFGGEGTGTGLFKNANEVTVDEQGNIFVADETMRVQRFDSNGKYLDVFTVPQNSQYYKDAETFKILVYEPLIGESLGYDGLPACRCSFFFRIFRQAGSPSYFYTQ